MYLTGSLSSRVVCSPILRGISESLGYFVHVLARCAVIVHEDTIKAATQKPGPTLSIFLTLSHVFQGPFIKLITQK